MGATLIIGAGWLGRPLALFLSKRSSIVHVTNQSLSGVSSSRDLGLKAHHLSLPVDDIALLSQFLIQHQVTTIVGCITPGFRKTLDLASVDWDSYAHKWQQICQGATQAGVDKLVMISSSAVYPSTEGSMCESDASYLLAMHSQDFSHKSKALLKAEQQVINSGLDYVVIRCSGLVNQQRHPSRFVQRLKSVSRKAPANMLHQQDAIGLISFAIDKLSRQIINASTPNTCSKAEFYQAALNAVQSSVILPEIVDTPDKHIDSQLSQKLGYRYHFQHTLDVL
ncbi:NAD(P)H-binding protein [Vibrio gallicus]|uniref:NAD(P)H-binding protein n=1 Tax=Vibrio gallicus TaxID=190897 RepID=UPI0021C4ACA2|nr:NAD(P)H-binding protein [Vibrio gallicus]